ncbi:hypothetical protein A1Q1_01811 [Trichosporon asahii var. asahii CBS 2479]|uniref:Uncharacterized protein n=1 Tax=Trichosporon asahii var. asahii (strain ATCC 90039 / CBS 2479 / JCM 2466 / KCTC 7840 / NBRC 103889/ NCYC 2677 / UAMH 7654) TaxID=1186058 RepID=J6F1W3_TRIAS|nr:hypothetical protein A1Q1_01811 [Trichosporon asahii var. asahii CBS 2479]EJT49162.1 hypothetical protein A1Q1_01811 [Trichosporon asahii var. asahii CBS 2479]
MIHAQDSLAAVRNLTSIPLASPERTPQTRPPHSASACIPSASPGYATARKPTSAPEYEGTSGHSFQCVRNRNGRVVGNAGLVIRTLRSVLAPADGIGGERSISVGAKMFWAFWAASHASHALSPPGADTVCLQARYADEQGKVQEKPGYRKRLAGWVHDRWQSHDPKICRSPALRAAAHVVRVVPFALPNVRRPADIQSVNWLWSSFLKHLTYLAIDPGTVLASGGHCLGGRFGEIGALALFLDTLHAPARERAASRFAEPDADTRRRPETMSVSTSAASRRRGASRIGRALGKIAITRRLTPGTPYLASYGTMCISGQALFSADPVRGKLSLGSWLVRSARLRECKLQVTESHRGAMWGQRPPLPHPFGSPCASPRSPASFASPASLEA